MEKHYHTIDCEQLRSLLKDDDTLLLDCRKLNDYRVEHIDGALRVHDDLIQSLIDGGDRSQAIAIYCYHGHTSEHLAEALSNAGFIHVSSLTGGYEAWKKHHFK